MKIFITGVAGFLGSHLADKFIDLGHTVAGVDNLIGGFRCNLNDKIKFFEADCCNQKAMHDIIKSEEIDVVVHCAATAHEGFSVFSPSFITRNIYEASVSVISASIANNVKRFVFCSSMARYGNQNGNSGQFTEDMKPMPVDPYGIAKVAAEDTLKCLSGVHGMQWNIAVPHNIIGERQRFDDPYRNVVSIMANRNLQNKPSIIYGDGEQKRCFSYVSDCVSCLTKMVLDKDIVNEVINIGPDEGEVTINELSQLVAEKCNFNGNPIYKDDRPQEVKNALCSSNKARKMLSYETSTTLREAVKKTVDYISSVGPRDFDYTYKLEIINDKTPSTWKDRLM
jgi:UDP-glucose 4-epimerase